MNFRFLMRSRAVISVLAATASVWILAGCGAKAGAPVQKQAQSAPLVGVQPASSKTLTETIETTGEVVATTTAVIRSMAEGEIAFCPWREGDRVSLGEKLVEIDRRLLREELAAAEASMAVAQARLADMKAGTRPEEIAQAREAARQIEASVNFARIDIERIQALVQSESMPGEALEKARVESAKLAAQLAAARERLSMLEAGPTKTAIAVQEALVAESTARIETSRARLAETVVTAPFPGTVTRVHVRQGDVASARAPLLDVREDGSIAVRFSVPEARAGSLRKDMTGIVRFDAFPGRAFGMTVTRVFPDLDASARTFTVEAVIADAPAIAPGMFARVSLMIREITGAVVVQDAALRTLPSGATAVFVLEGEKATMRRVKVGIEKGREVQILEGVNPGEPVIVAGNERLKDGTVVRVAQKGQGTPGGGQGGGDKK